MIEHLHNHLLGLIHVLNALAALLFGALVIFARKGTPFHRRMGRWYFAFMLAMNGTALLDYELYGRFGPFHWMALISLATVVAGYMAARNRKAYWKPRHAYLMSWSYVGLIAAAAAEVASRVPGWSFGPSVVVSSLVIIVTGGLMMHRWIPHIIGGSLKGGG